MDNEELQLVYPTFQVFGGRGIFPNVWVPSDFLDRVPRFYEQGRREDVEKYAQDLGKMLSEGKISGGFPDIMLQWDEKRGLVNISVGIHGGFDLTNEDWPHFQEHNLGGENGYAAGFIAMEYVSELLKS